MFAGTWQQAADPTGRSGVGGHQARNQHEVRDMAKEKLFSFFVFIEN